MRSRASLGVSCFGSVFSDGCSSLASTSVPCRTDPCMKFYVAPSLPSTRRWSPVVGTGARSEWHRELRSSSEGIAVRARPVLSRQYRNMALWMAQGRAVHANMCPEEGYLSQLLSKVCLKPVPPPIFLKYLCSVWADVLDPLVLVPGWQCECHFCCQGRCESRDHCPSAMKLGPLRRPPQRPSALAPQTCTPRSFGRRGSAARSETTATS